MGDAGRQPADRFQFLRQLKFNHHALALLHFGHELVLKFLLLAGFDALGRDVGAHRHRVRQSPVRVVQRSDGYAQPKSAAIAPRDFVFVLKRPARTQRRLDLSEISWGCAPSIASGK